MASTYRALAGTGAASGTSVIVAKPTGAVDNDLLVAVIATTSGGGTIVPPAGWRQVYADTTLVNHAIFLKTAAGEGANYTFNWSVSKANASGIFAFYNSTPRFRTDVEVQAVKSFAASPDTLPAMTTNRAGDLVLALMLSTAGGTSWASTPANYTGLGDFAQSGLVWGVLYRLDAPVGAQSVASTSVGFTPAQVLHFAIPQYYLKQSAVL
jgi:hypothetical protein